MPSGLINDGKQVQVEFGDGVYLPAFKHTSIFANGRAFLNELVEESMLRKVEIIKRTFKDQADLLSLKERFIYNCTGMGAGALFQDSGMLPVKGTLVYLKKPINYYFTAATPDGTVTVYPSQGRLTLGLSREEGRSGSEVEDWQVDRILLNAMRFFGRNKAAL